MFRGRQLFTSLAWPFRHPLATDGEGRRRPTTPFRFRSLTCTSWMDSPGIKFVIWNVMSPVWSLLTTLGRHDRNAGPAWFKTRNSQEVMNRQPFMFSPMLGEITEFIFLIIDVKVYAAQTCK